MQIVQKAENTFIGFKTQHFLKDLTGHLGEIWIQWWPLWDWSWGHLLQRLLLHAVDWLAAISDKLAGQPFPSLSTQKEKQLFWLWGSILWAVMSSNAYVKIHESTLILKWIIHSLISQYLVASVASIMVRKVCSWIWNRNNKNQAFLFNLQVLHMALPEKAEIILIALISFSLYRSF